MDRLVKEAVTLANTTGFLMSTNGDSNLSHTPFSLTPARVKSSEYATAVRLARLLNTVSMNIAGDYAFLRRTLSQTAAGDPAFTGRLLSMLDLTEASRPNIEFTINRYDFFPDSSADPHAAPSARGLRMVEMNCIAAGGLAQAGLISALHRATAGHPAAAAAGVRVDPHALPPNDILRSGALAFVEAHAQFCALYSRPGDPPARIVMVVIPPYVNACDQDMLRWRLWSAHGVDCVRLTLAEILEHGSLRDDGVLVVDGCAGMPRFVVSVAYFRSAYMPDEYPSEREWAARALLERSRAVSCPSVAMQLVGTKRVQQALAEPGVLARFCERAEDAALIAGCFVRQFALHPGPAGDRAAQMAIAHPQGFVMKPQREGGGNNLYADDMQKALLQLDDKERGGYVLMERIHPPAVKGVLVRNGEWAKGDIVCEIGIYGSVIRVYGEETENAVIGHSMKSKLSHVDDGGIGAGVAVYDSPQLV